MAWARFSGRGVQHLRQRHLDAEIDHAVAVIGQDDIDQVLADVVHVALHGRQHDGAFLLALDPFHERFQVGDRGLHRLGALQHERQLHLARAEQLAHHLHAVEQDVVDDVERRQCHQRLVEFRGQPLAVAIDDAVLQPALHRLGALLHRGVGQLCGRRRSPACAATDRSLRRGGRRSGLRRPSLPPPPAGAAGGSSIRARSRRSSPRASRDRGTRCSAPRAPPGSARS